MAALREIFASFGIQFNGRPLERGARQVERMTGRIRNLVTVAAGTFALRGFTRFIRATIDMGDELDKTSQQVGLTVDQLERLRYVANLGGVEASQLANALGQLQRRADDAAHGGTTTGEAFRRLGVDVHDASGELLNAHDLFIAVAEGIHNLDNASERTALSMELMGRMGRQLLPMMSDGAAGIERLEAEFTSLVGGSLQEFVTLSRDAQDDLTRFSTVMMSFRARLAVLFLPIIRRAITTVSQWAGMLRDLAANSRIAEAALISLGVVAGVVALATIGTWGPILLVVAAAALLALVIDDLWTAMEGGDAVIARVFDRLAKAAGVGFRFVHVIEAIRTQWKWLTEPRSIIASIDQLLMLNRAGFRVRDVLAAVRGQWQLLVDGASNGVRVWKDVAVRFRAVQAVVDALIQAYRTLMMLQEAVTAMWRGAATGEARAPRTAVGEAAGGLGERHYRRARSGGVNVYQAIRGGATSGKGPIDASSAVTIQVSGGAYDSPTALANAISAGVRDQLDRHARRLEATLVPRLAPTGPR